MKKVKRGACVCVRAQGGGGVKKEHKTKGICCGGMIEIQFG